MVRIKFVKPFKDGQLWQRLAEAGFWMDHENPTMVHNGAEGMVSEELAGQVKSAGGEFEVLFVEQAEPILASPAALALAEEWGLDLAGIPGSGEDGKLLKADVENLIEQLED